MVGKRTHILLTSYEEDRLAAGLEEWAVDKVIIVYNKNPLPKHQSAAKETREIAKKLVESKTNVFNKAGGIEEVGLDFYHFKEATVGLYEILYREKLLGNEVFINISGGTRPAAIASIFACALCGVGNPIYFFAEGYNKKTTGSGNFIPASVGVDKSVHTVEMLDTLFNLQSTIPSRTEEVEILLALSSVGGNYSSLSQILERIGVEKPFGKRQAIKQQVISKYYRSVVSLESRKFIERNRKRMKLTLMGTVAADILKARKNVEEDLSD